MLPALSRRALTLLAAGLGLSARAQTPPAAEPAPLPLFAVQVRTGPRWEAAKPPVEQAFFREHSAHLKKLRDAGHIVVGARYSDVGLLVVAAPDEAAVRALMDEDPSMKAETFRFDVHPFNVFYGGTLQPRPRRT